VSQQRAFWQRTNDSIMREASLKDLMIGSSEDAKHNVGVFTKKIRFTVMRRGNNPATPFVFSVRAHISISV
jgi:hypothetical protein